MLLSALALSVGLSGSPAPMSPTSREGAGTVVYLGCMVSNSSLTDCKVVNDDPVDVATADEALRLAQAMTVPPSLAERHAGRIVVKLTVKR